MTVYILIFAVYALCVILMCRLAKNKKLKTGTALTLAVFMLALCVRLYYATRDFYYYYDMSCFKGWAELSHIHGLKGMYKGDFFLDYPPGYIYVLWVTGAIRRWLNLDYEGLAFTFLIKRGPVIADMVFGAVVYDVAYSEKGRDTALVRSAAWLFNPAMIYNSSVWGQVDSFYILFLVLSLYFITKDKIVPASLTYAIALITKPQSLLFGPVLLLYMIEKKNLKYLVTAIVTGVVTLYLLILPYTTGLNPLWIIDLYRSTLNSYNRYSVNAYNLYGLLGRNWWPLGVRGALITPVVVVALLILLFWQYFRHKTPGKNFTSAFVSIAILFTLCTKMHERYLLPAIALALMAWVMGEGVTYLYFSLFATGICLVNIVAVLLDQYTEYTISKGAIAMTGAFCCVLCGLAVLAYVGDSCLRKEKLTLAKKQ